MCVGGTENINNVPKSNNCKHHQNRALSQGNQEGGNKGTVK